MIKELRLDESVWETGNPMRRAEWRASIDDLVGHAQLTTAYAGHYVLLSMTPAWCKLEFLDEEGEVKHHAVIEFSLLDPHVREYLAIIRRLDEGAGHREASWVEAVDMAKKVVHDTAARTLESALPDLSTDHETYRRLFTLLLSLLVDTTMLVHARGHRSR